VSDLPDWKQKYRDTLRELESEEQRWLKIEQALRRLVGRLCAAGMGVSPILDDELVVLAAANRRNAPAEELEQLAGSLTTAVVAVDALAPVIAAPTRAVARWDATCAAVEVVLRSLGAASPQAAAATELISRLARAATDTELAAIVTQAADLIGEHGAELARERLRSAQVLTQVTERLEEVASYLNETGEAARLGFEDTTSFNEDIMSQVRTLSAEAHSATELGALQSLVTARMHAVSRQAQEFRVREEAREHEQTVRSERMLERIMDLERETQELRKQLDQAARDARLDTLTGLPNRKSFDERFAAEIKRCATGARTSLLLWDIDDFKIINDTYGHRAGDRVLQTVASCFFAALRGEHFIARIGGEEFMVIMADLAPTEVLTAANGLRSSVAALKFHFRGAPVRVTVSCGIAAIDQSEPASAIFDRADAALYRAKRGGKNLCIAA
jgi:diguanylate cyclase